MKKVTFQLLANSHLDPVWLWDWREGLNEGITTIRTMLQLMRERPELTYIRGESLIYKQVEQYDPESFEQIREYVKAGRWDVVGGSYLQPDMNMPGTETLLRHYLYGQNYFKERFGKTVKVAWSADCFGHTAGLPDILHAAGINAYIYGRPVSSKLEKLFWWEGPTGARILTSTYMTGWYGCERGEIAARLDAYLAASGSSRVRNIFIPIGLGNHGGGPTRRQLDDVAKWAAAHPEVEVKFSGHHGYFAAVKKEIAEQKIELPVVRGELNFTLRGCYSSAARIKFAYRQAEAQVMRTEALSTAVAAQLGKQAPSCTKLWEDVLFNSFHDILPGTSTERALDEQSDWLGGTRHAARAVERDALLALAQQVDTTAPAPAKDMPAAVRFLVWNPLPTPYRGPLELEAPLDYRPIFPYDKRPGEVPVELRDAKGKVVPFQQLRSDHLFMSTLPWRKRVLLDADIPALGWSSYTLGWVEGAKKAQLPNTNCRAVKDGICNERYEVRAKVGKSGLEIFRDGKALLGKDGLTVVTVEDAYGPWGGHYDEAEANDCSTVREVWKITETAVLESGPLRSVLWVRYAGGNSRCELTVQLFHNRDAVDVAVRLFFNESRARVKLRFPVGTQAEYDVPGASIVRGAEGEVPGNRWVRVLDAKSKPGWVLPVMRCTTSIKSRAAFLRRWCVRAGIRWM